MLITLISDSERGYMKSFGTRLLLSVLVFIAAIVGSNAEAQVGILSVGAPQGSSTFPIVHGIVNLGNGDVHIEIPIEDYAQRGDVKLPAKLVYDSEIWMENNPCDVECWMWQPLQYATNEYLYAPGYGPYEDDIFGGWRLEYQSNHGIEQQALPGIPCSNWDGYGQLPPEAAIYPDVLWWDSNNTVHMFPISTFMIPQGCNNPVDGNYYTDTPSGSAYASDGSGYYATVTNYNTVTIFDPHGDEVDSTTTDPTPIDRNGNHLEYGNYLQEGDYGQAAGTGLEDTRGHTLITESLSGQNITNSTTEYLDVAVAGGKTARFAITYKEIEVQTDFGIPGVPEWGGTMLVPTSLVLPDGTSYQFTYEEGSYGELTSITLPHGGKESFTYTNNLGAGGVPPSRIVKSYTGADGTTTFNWSNTSSSPYSEQGKTCGEVTNEVSNGATSRAYFFSDCNGAILPRKVITGPAGSTTIDTIQLFNYDTSNACPTFGTNNVYHVCTGALWRNLTDKTESLFSSDDNSAVTTDTQYSYQTPGSGIPTTIKQWDYYNGAPSSLPDSPPGSPTREFDITLGYTVNHALYPTQVVTKDSTGTVSTTTYTYDEPAYFDSTASTAPNHDDSYVTGNRGNPTTIAVCCDQNGNSLSSHFVYDDAGAVLKSQDPNGNWTTYGYDPTDTFVQSITLPPTQGPNGTVPHVIKRTYDPTTGQLSSITGENGQTTTYDYDQIGRVSTVKYSNAENPVTLETVTYPSANETDVATLQSDGVTLNSSTMVDSYGRTISSIQGNVSTETTYNTQGQVWTVTNPHTQAPSSTDGTTTYGYDELGRVKSIELPSGNSYIYSYSENETQVTDPLNHSRAIWQDAFGDVAKVAEPNSTGALNWITSYQYNGLGLLAEIQQQGGVADTSQWRTRTFNYDGLGRLISQDSPEASVWAFGYDNNGNLQSATDSNPTDNNTQYTYDADNRLIGTSLAGGPSYTYVYDGQDGSGDSYGVGRLTSTTNGSNVETLFTHDVFGRVNSEAYCLPSNYGSNGCSSNYKVQSAYDYQGNLTSLTYPDGRTIKWSYDLMNRPISETYQSWGGNQVNTPYFSNASYYPGGQLQQVTYGNGVEVGASYDSNENLLGLAYLAGGKAIVANTYTWDATGENLQKIQDSASGRTVTYTYDQLNRIASYSDSGTTTTACVAGLANIPASAQTYTIDAWGNLQQVANGGYSFIQPVTSNNQVEGYGYDSAGDMTTDGLGNNYQYRADGLMSGSEGYTYTYDALGQRVRKNDSSTGVNEYIYYGGQLLAMRDPQTGAWTDRVYGPVGALATVPVSGAVDGSPVYRIGDHLGSLADTVDASGNVTGTSSVLPYGQSMVNTTGDNFVFTDHERDPENGSDATLYRHYSSTEGRWLSPDPSNGSYDLTDPQSLNRYVYLGNRPMADVDAVGLDGDDDGGDDWVDAYLDWGGDWSDFAYGSSSNFSFEISDVSSGASFSDMSLAWNSSDNAAVSASTTIDQSFGFTDWAQTALNVAGNIPEIGAVANGANALISLARGNNTQAAMYAGAAALSVFVPGGQAIAESGELAVDAVEAEQEAQTAQTLFHYTDEKGLTSILDSGELNPSLKTLNPNDVRYGNGQYLSDIEPGTKTPAQLSRHFLNVPYQGARYTHYIEIDTSGLNAVQGRPGVFVIPGETPLDLGGRIISSGKVPIP